VAIRDARDQQLKLCRRRVGGEEAQRRVALEHRLLRAAGHLHLEEVIHRREVVDAGLVDGLAHAGKGRADRLSTALNFEVDDVDAEPHACLPVEPTSPWRCARPAGPWPRPSR
jgi:hypothetical protein